MSNLMTHVNPLDKRATARARAARGRSRWSPGGVRAVSRAPPRTAACALLPHARVGARRRGRSSGGAAAGLARAVAVRGPQLVAFVALHDRNQHVPERDRAAAQARASDRLRAGDRPPRRTWRTDRGVGVARAIPRRDAWARRRLRGSRGEL